MGVAIASYFALDKVREMGPDAKDWAATDGNMEAISILLKFFEQHTHSGTAAINYPGYNVATPTSPTLPVLTEFTTGGILTPGSTVGVRLAYRTTIGLETEASPEATYTIAPAGSRPLAPSLTSIQLSTPGLSGGTYIYAITKRKGSGETVISDVLPVEIPYDGTYSVTLAFDAISFYTDGTTAISIYRSNGLSAPFQLVTNVTTAVSNYTDQGVVVAGNQNIQPPTINTFDAARKVRINWAGLTPHPSGANKLVVYVTQQTGIWGNSSSLITYDIATAPTFVDYLGSESLEQGSPKNASQIPSMPPQINLNSDVTMTGVFTLSNHLNFNGNQAQNLRLHNNSGTPASPTNGYIYYDTSTNNVRAYINGVWTNWGVTAGTAYSHPAEEVGGHIAANLKYTAGGVTLKSILDRITNTTTGGAKQVQSVVRVIGATAGPTTAAVAKNTTVFIPEMSTTSPSVAFTSQWTEIHFTGTFTHNGSGRVLFLALEIGGVSGETYSETFSLPIESRTVHLHHMTQTANASTVKVLWWVSSGLVMATGLSRVLTAKLVF